LQCCVSPCHTAHHVIAHLNAPPCVTSPLCVMCPRAPPHVTALRAPVPYRMSWSHAAPCPASLCSTPLRDMCLHAPPCLTTLCVCVVRLASPCHTAHHANACPRTTHHDDACSHAPPCHGVASQSLTSPCNCGIPMQLWHREQVSALLTEEENLTNENKHKDCSIKIFTICNDISY